MTIDLNAVRDFYERKKHCKQGPSGVKKKQENMLMIPKEVKTVAKKVVEVDTGSGDQGKGEHANCSSYRDITFKKMSY